MEQSKTLGMLLAKNASQGGVVETKTPVGNMMSPRRGRRDIPKITENLNVFLIFVVVLMSCRMKSFQQQSGFSTSQRVYKKSERGDQKTKRKSYHVVLAFPNLENSFL